MAHLRSPELIASYGGQPSPESGAKAGTGTGLCERLERKIRGNCRLTPTQVRSSSDCGASLAVPEITALDFTDGSGRTMPMLALKMSVPRDA